MVVSALRVSQPPHRMAARTEQGESHTFCIVYASQRKIPQHSLCVGRERIMIQDNAIVWTVGLAVALCKVGTGRCVCRHWYRLHDLSLINQTTEKTETDSVFDSLRLA